RRPSVPARPWRRRRSLDRRVGTRDRDRPRHDHALTSVGARRLRADRPPRRVTSGCNETRARVNAGPRGSFSIRDHRLLGGVPMLDVRVLATARRFVVVAMLGACAAAHADPAARLDFDAARHLLVRTGFGPTLAEVDALVGRSREDAVDAILASARSEPFVSPPAWTATLPAAEERPHPGMSADERKAYRARERAALVDLRGWWMTEMRETPSPLTERMTLFWHNHFATGVQKVRDPRLMYA